eukprot:scaffold37920_cov31-Tisochrysis_lutea.AAC.2
MPVRAQARARMGGDRSSLDKSSLLHSRSAHAALSPLLSRTLSTPPRPQLFPPAIRRLPPCTTRRIGVKALDMVRWPAPLPNVLVRVFTPAPTRQAGLNPDLSCK